MGHSDLEMSEVSTLVKIMQLHEERTGNCMVQSLSPKLMLALGL